VVAYARNDGSKWALVIVPVGLVEKATNRNFSDKENWKNVSIKLPNNAPQKWENEFTGEIIESNGTLQASNLFRKFSVALLSGSL
jgi:(1->4)-alpha-D-glucan 1-alpha-D-glucosylmutase